jgi:glutamyl-tRNA reductase
LASFKGIASSQIQQYFTIFSDTSSAVLHLFRVGIGLESQVLGDFQIINQVKNAYQWCADSQTAGPFLHRLLHTIFFANKKIVQETNFRSGSASVSYAAKELSEELLTDKSQPILFFGLGEIGLATVRNLAENGFSNITICNRTESKVESLIQEFGIKYKSLDDFNEVLAQSKLVISALSGDVLKINKRNLKNKQLVGFQYFIDLGLPRSVNPEIEDIDGVVLFNLDQIQTRVNAALELRSGSIPAVEEIVKAAQLEFLEWTKEMQVSPVIHQIKNALEQIRMEEMARFLKKADAEQAVWAEDLTKNLMQRIMKNHVVQLKAACKRGEADQLVEVLNQIFNFEVPVEN